MIKVGIIGSTGYAGAELARLLLQRDDVEIVWYGSRSYVGEDFASIYRNVAHRVSEPCRDDDMEELSKIADVIFTATPQGFCASKVTEDILSRTKIIDLSADFRMKDVDVYEQWYKITHASPQFIEEAVYGL
ncbi:MAG: N-acetyl-gamma-glutamyl-phosphate reductase, partial [Lachnospiraceae bacterium]|nr:N-acetyl-gamma-glutamyl-phosphate reductase [Lachnospiraceae bacterium]